MPEERKLVTILFADVTGSTALGEFLDPEDLRALMSRYYDHAREVIASLRAKLLATMYTHPLAESGVGMGS